MNEKKSLEIRARDLIEKIFIGMDVSPSFLDNAVVDVILFGKFQDKLTRHTIAEALSKASHGAIFEGADNTEYKILYEEEAHEIAMNINAV